MKKFSILGLCLFAGLSMSAQMDLMKDVERTVKSGNFNYSEIKPQLDQITQNDETKNNVKAWMIAGNAAFANYDALFMKVQMGQDVDKKEIGNSMIDGYNYMMSALPLDTIVDDKGKVKAKESKKIIKTIAENYAHFNNAGIFLWEAEDYAGAYKAWDIYTSLPNDSRMEQVGLKADHDTIVAQIVFNKALAAWQMNDYEKALISFEEALNKGYDKKNLYDYAISVATSAGKSDVAASYARMAQPKFGNEDPIYLQVIVNDYLSQGKADKAKEYLESLLQMEPTNAILIDLIGVCLENSGKQEEAIAKYKNAIEINPSLPIARFHLGNILYNKAYAIDNDASSLPQAQYDKIRAEQTEPLLREAAMHLEEAFKLDENNTDALKHLKNIYYILGDQENLKRVELI